VSNEEDYRAALEQYPALRLYADDPEHLLSKAQTLETMPAGESLGFQREFALQGAALAKSTEERLEWKRDIASSSSMLTEEEMHMTIEELIIQGRWEPTLVDADLP